LHHVEPYGSCGYICLAHGIDQANKDPSLRAELDEIFSDVLPYWNAFREASNEIITKSKLPSLTVQDRFSMSTALPIRLLISQGMIDNPSLFNDIFRERSVLTIIPKITRQHMLELNRAGLKGLTKELCSNDHQNALVVRHAVLLLLFPERRESWLDESYSNALTIILGGKLAICCLHGQAEDQINFLSNDLPGETKVILFLKLAHEHFEIVQMNGHSLFVFDNLNSTLAKGQSAHVPDPSMNSRQISQQVNAGQGHIDRFFKPKAETERSQQINEGKRIFQPFQKQNLQLKALSPEIARAGAFIERMAGIGALQVLKEMAPNVSRLLTAQITLGSEPFLNQQTVRLFVGISDITRRLHSLVYNLHSKAAIKRNQ
jgi:hypothetical protein